jgi:ABC-type nitrate/sulfonate/bicarbonate transport system ATPase subunit
MSGAHIELRKICQSYPDGKRGSNLIVKDISLTFEKPGLNMLLGPSGCGKSTLLRMMGGVRPFDVLTPSSGDVLIDNVNCDGPHDDAVMVFQRYSNRPDLSVYENIAFPFGLGLWKKKVNSKDAAARVEQMIQAVGLSDKRELRPHELSGGQNQRVALARALALRPRILLMDEPFGALDAQTREEMQKLLVELYNNQPCTIVFVTHDVSEALLLGDRVLVFSTQPATIVDDFAILEPRPRAAHWLASEAGQAMQDRVITRLHKSPGSGQVRVTV